MSPWVVVSCSLCAWVSRDVTGLPGQAAVRVPLDCAGPSALWLPPHVPFLSLQEILRPYGAFWLTAAFCILSVLFTLTFVPETKGRTLEQVTAHFEGR